MICLVFTESRERALDLLDLQLELWAVTWVLGTQALFKEASA